MVADAKTRDNTLVRTCGTCAYRRSRVWLTPKLLGACSRICQDPERIDANTVATLVDEIETLRRRKLRCGKEHEVWTHLMDRACGFWQPAEDNILSC